MVGDFNAVHSHLYLLLREKRHKLAFFMRCLRGMKIVAASELHPEKNMNKTAHAFTILRSGKPWTESNLLY